jgi:hypothetical protein
VSRYFFHLSDGESRLIDPQGTEIDDPAQLPAQALREARAIIAHDVQEGRIDLNQKLTIEDEHGMVVHELKFTDAVEVRGAAS